MRLLSILAIGVGGSLIAVLILLIVKAMDSKHGQAMGLVNQQLSACSNKPNCVNSESFSPADKRVKPLQITPQTHVAEQAPAWLRLQTSIKEQGGELVRVEDTYLAATFTSSLFGFVDDLEARLDEKNMLIHIRSGARVGTSDMGVNRTRVELLRQRFNQQR